MAFPGIFKDQKYLPDPQEKLEMPGHPEVKIRRASETHSPRVMIFMLDGMGG